MRVIPCAVSLLLALLASVSCVSTPEASSPPEKAPPSSPHAPAASGEAKPASDVPAGGGHVPAKSAAKSADSEKPAEEEKEGRSFLVGMLMYLPNRVMDLFDMIRFGVNVGPGIGVDLAATDALQAQAFSHASVGVGLQSFRHTPVFMGTEAGLGVGPLGAVGDLGATWYRSPTDLRVGLYVAILGAHVAIDPVEIADFLLGFLTIDIRDDDF
jgi:hypothetical protein